MNSKNKCNIYINTNKHKKREMKVTSSPFHNFKKLTKLNSNVFKRFNLRTNYYCKINCINIRVYRYIIQIHGHIYFY